MLEIRLAKRRMLLPVPKNGIGSGNRVSVSRIRFKINGTVLVVICRASGLSKYDSRKFFRVENDPRSLGLYALTNV